MAEPLATIDIDIAVLGGGVAGLWLINRLRQAGFAAALFEANALGGGQTLASQGMIHGGMKYTLNGALTGASETIADMPRYWRDCLCGQGEINLATTRILSDHFYFWSGDSAVARFKGFLASKLLHGRIEPVAELSRPSLLRHADFQGSLYRLGDMVLDTHSLVNDLARQAHGHIFSNKGLATRLINNGQGGAQILFTLDNATLAINAKRVILTAGEGNQALLEMLGAKQPQMQRRPLKQVMVRHHYPHRFYGHLLGQGTTPRLTISSHPLADGSMVWYLGGQLAEQGAQMTDEQVIALAKKELAELLPWLDFSEAEYTALFIDRAEPLTANFARPDNAFAEPVKNLPEVICCWPTKLTLAPNLASQVLSHVNHLPRGSFNGLSELCKYLPSPDIGLAPWDIAFPCSHYAPPEANDETE